MKYEIKAHGKSEMRLKELWQFRELLLMLALRDFKVRYAQTFLGILWAFLQPLVTLLIFILIFDKAIKVNTGSVPYPIFALAGMTVWNYFSYVVAQAGNSIIGAQSIITKIYFPRLIIPLSKALVGVIDFVITLFFLAGVLFYYKFAPSFTIFYLPLFLLLLLILSGSVGILFSALAIRFRDIQHTIPFIIQVGMYLSPIAYPASLVPEKYRLFYDLNPLTGIIEGFRWCITGTEGLPVKSIVFSVVITSFLCIISTYYFRKVEEVIADII